MSGERLLSLNIGTEKLKHLSQTWELTSVIRVLGRLKQEDQEFKLILGYIVSLRPGWDIRDHVSKNNACVCMRERET